MPFLARAGAISSLKSAYSVATNSCARRWMALKVSVGLIPSAATSLVSLSICCLIPATRISKNSSRLELKMVRNLTRSINGWVGSCASSRTRRLNSSQLSSRLMKFSEAEKREGEVPSEFSALGSATIFDGSSGAGVSDFGFIAHRPERLIAKSDCFEKAALFRFGGHSWRPAFDDFKGEEAKEREPRKLEVEPQIFRDLGDGAHAVELGRELGFGDGEAKLLDALETIAGISRNAAGFQIAHLAKFLQLDAAQSAEDPMIDVGFARQILAIIGQGVALLEDEADAGSGPELGEEFLSVMLDQLRRRFRQDQFFTGQGEENRLARLTLGRACLFGFLGLHVDERDRRFGAIELRIAGGDKNDLPISREKLNRFLAPERAEGAGQFLFPDRLQRAIEREKGGVAREKRAVDRERRFFGWREGGGGIGGRFKSVG